MRIFFDARSLLEEHPSGVSFFAYYLSHALVRCFPEHQFVFFTNKFSSSVHSLNLPQKENVKIVSRRIPNKILHLFFSLFNKPVLEKLVGPCDVFYFPNIHFLPTPPKKSVLTLHDISYLHTPDLYSFKTELWYWVVRAKKRIVQMSALCVDSEATRYAVNDMFPKIQDRVSVVYPAPTKLLRNERTKQSHFLLLGDVDERKNIEGALRAYERVRSDGTTSLPLYIVGKRGYVNLHSNTQGLLKSLKQKGWVIERGYVSSEEKTTLLQGARALLFVSHYEGFGFPGLEAQSLGIPIIVSSRSSLPEILGEGPLYVDPRNIQSVVEALTVVSRDDFPESITYHNKILDRTWDDVAKDMMNIFSRI